MGTGDAGILNMVNKRRVNISEKAAERGEPSYIWRSGQQRRMDMIRKWSGERLNGPVLETGCGLGEYLARIGKTASLAVGLDVELSRLVQAKVKNPNLVCAKTEHLPFAAGAFNVVLSNEVIEHVEDDRMAAAESVRVLKKRGRFLLFCPNRGYPFETHGIYRKGEYRFGNKPFVNYLPDKLRNRLAPHVRAYTKKELSKLFGGLPVTFIYRTIIYGGYDNLIQKWRGLGRAIRSLMHFLEKTPLKILGLSHFWVIEKE